MHPAQPTSPLTPDERAFSRWFAAVVDHRPGEIDAPLLVAAALSTEGLRTLWVRVQLLLRVVDRPAAEFERALRVTALDSAGLQITNATLRLAQPLDRRFVLEEVALGVERIGRTATCRRAAMLHTDVAVLAAEVAAAAGGSVSTSAPLRVFVGDGASLGAENVSLHWEFARRMADQIRPDPRADRFVRRWYQATLLHAQASESFDSLQLRHALRLFPDDPLLVFAAGCEREAFASPIFQEFARQIDDARMRPDFGPADGELRRAEAYFRRVVDAEPTFTEAAVHLGRVLGLQGDHAAAARLLTAALDAGGDAFVTYYAALFLGAECEALHRLGDAQAAYERAAQAMPQARLPHLALAHLARQTGERAHVVDRLKRALAPVPDDPADEPWYVYRRSHARGADAAMTEARRLATEATP